MQRPHNRAPPTWCHTQPITHDGESECSGSVLKRDTSCQHKHGDYGQHSDSLHSTANELQWQQPHISTPPPFLLCVNIRGSRMAAKLPTFDRQQAEEKQPTSILRATLISKTPRKADPSSENHRERCQCANQDFVKVAFIDFVSFATFYFCFFQDEQTHL